MVCKLWRGRLHNNFLLFAFCGRCVPRDYAGRPSSASLPPEQKFQRGASIFGTLRRVPRGHKVPLILAVGIDENAKQIPKRTIRLTRHSSGSVLLWENKHQKSAARSSEKKTPRVRWARIKTQFAAANHRKWSEIGCEISSLPPFLHTECISDLNCLQGLG